jgi:hypothetical protein
MPDQNVELNAKKEVPERGTLDTGVGTEHQQCARVDQFVLQGIMSFVFTRNMRGLPTR